MKKFAALVAVFALVAFAAPALAANPFMDVPMNHWAYDAVSQLASRGVVSGYPDGSFKGEWKATRYEMASVVARALAYVDMNKASKQDLELLKRLVVEFKDELDALGVKVEELDARVAVLESDIGGWALSGQFRFDAKWSGGGLWDYNSGDEEAIDGGDLWNMGSKNVYTGTGDTDFTMSRYRLWITKRIDDKVNFIGRVGGPDLTWQRYYLSVTLPWDATMWVGLWLYDWEGDDGLWNDNDALFTDMSLNGFYMTKSFGMGDFSMFVAHKDPLKFVTGVGYSSTEPEEAIDVVVDDAYVYGARLNFAFNEQFGASFNYVAMDADSADFKHSVWWVAPYVNFTPGITLKGAYFDTSFSGPGYDGNAWKAILDVKQDVTGITSIWIEYMDVDREFYAWNASGLQYGQARGLAQYDDFGGPMTPGLGEGFADGSVLFVRLDQQWNDTWATFQRFGQTSIGTAWSPVLGDMDGDFDTTFWTFGVKYWYTPALSFELSYDNVSYGAGWNDLYGVTAEDDSMIRLRTFVSF